MSSLEKFKCGYCGWIIWHDENGRISHSCLANHNHFFMDDDRNLFTNKTHLHEMQRNTANKENIAENIESTANDSIEEIDEDLIAAVKERPALYDYRIPVKERGRKQKDHLWQEVSNCLKGFYSATEAEKRWLYLKDCYRKARNIVKKKESFVQKSGAAGLPKNYEIKPSFRHYNAMNFLNDTLTYRQTVTSLKKSMIEDQVSTFDNNVPSTSTNNNFDDNLTIINDDDSTSISAISPTASTSKKRKGVSANDYEEAYEEYDNMSELSINVLRVENQDSNKRIRHIRKLLLIKRVIDWKTMQLSWPKEIRRQQLVKTLLLYHLLKNKEEKQEKQRKFWVRPIFTEEQRYYQGDSDNLIKEMENDSEKYLEYLRMTKASFNKLLDLLKSKLTKQHFLRTPISPYIRLQICLRYLASGDTMHSISFAFRIGLNTVSKIIAETCEVIWDVLKDKVFPDITEDMWIQKAKEFELLWDFPNCIGAIDGKHVQIQAPPKSGSTFYNYKRNHSIVLLALADANCCFTVVDIGAEGRRSDGGIFQSSEFKCQLEEKRLNIPKARLLSDKGINLPYVIISDEAFALTSYMLRPYPRKTNLTIDKKVFNYRLSRARRTVECAFGILSSRWRIFRRPMATSVNNTISIVKATVCLHNFLMTIDLALPMQNRTYSVNPPRVINEVSQNSQTFAIEDNICGSTVRDELKNYFCTFGAIEQQWEKAQRNNF